MVSITCPKCEKSDSIQKVSTISSEAVSTTSIASYANVSKTALAKMLRQPTEPTKPKEFSPVFYGLRYEDIESLIAVCFILSTLIGLLFVVLRIECGAVTVFIVAFVILGIFLLPKIKEMNIKEAKTQTEAHKKWEHQISNWWELYYCSRDDCVFNPRTNEYDSPNNMIELLNK